MGRGSEVIIQERGKTHGNWVHQSRMANALKTIVNSRGTLTASHAEALDMICVKVARIICGNPNCADHWDDIAGYAILGRSTIDKLPERVDTLDETQKGKTNALYPDDFNHDDPTGLWDHQP
jgi:hypothetical protein